MAQCTAMSCPRLRADPDDRSMAIDFPSTLVIRDVLGNTWCNYCIKHFELINWGKAHDWPEIHVTGEYGKYAIGEGEWNWQTSVLTSRQDAIDAYHAAVITRGKAMEQLLVENQEQQRQARTQAWRERWKAKRGA